LLSTLLVLGATDDGSAGTLRAAQAAAHYYARLLLEVNS
jgi:hypothetical protein